MKFYFNSKAQFFKISYRVYISSLSNICYLDLYQNHKCEGRPSNTGLRGSKWSLGGTQMQTQKQTQCSFFDNRSNHGSKYEPHFASRIKAMSWSCFIHGKNNCESTQNWCKVLSLFAYIYGNLCHELGAKNMDSGWKAVARI